MNFFTKTKVLIAVIIVLSAIIIAIIGTVGIHYLKQKKHASAEQKENTQPGRYMAKQLKLTPEQIHEFDSLRGKFHSDIDIIEKDIKSTSRNIMEEIMLENPNRAKLDSLANKFGQLQAQQKLMMINHLLDIKGKCTMQQKECFSKLIKQMERRDRMNSEGHRNREHNREPQNKN